MNDETKVRVCYPLNRGAVRVGYYQPGLTYTVTALEAKRLVETKGFEYVDGEAADADHESED